MQTSILSCLAMALISCATLAGCASTPHAAESKPSAATPQAASLIGTWRLVSMNDPKGTVHPVNKPFFMRFYANGESASWPTPIAPISRGKYTFVDGQLTLPDAPRAGSLPVRVTETEMSYTTNDGGCVYRRVTPDLEPGQLP